MMLNLKKSILLAAVLAFGLASQSYAHTGQQPIPAVSAKPSALIEQLKMLEMGIVPTTPEDTIHLWAKAVKMRNGALQYELFTENIRSGVKPSMEQFHWVTGASSPWVAGYKVIRLPDHSENDSEQKYRVDFDLVTSTGKFGIDQAVVTLVKQGDQWYIQSLGPASEKSVGIWNTPESIHEQRIETTFEEMKPYHSFSAMATK